ncbi:MAG: 30S ribosomal protein S11 [Candidatus Blackburnbacteria bacterium RIFCSPHIGHO2_01_FULL_44_64]|uniref:Small ribosomal subunit protein uS11 n=1 Tax=Candidatus Blackburnbacteria bacterium RIFCSPHIGHO2_02_FULL_44_20 TaxID=1797516 RepID=A0A1G1VA96_9BACT|nr:MAG: 30S ribosomal protein S11 [Candidatus Blackburnbacteria bacterium RIFCSPHIGHO2_01_FULL_44_64]OGY11830.1 MAG: 30S ribosomal protein S11 [Candidatus Blackburnbacteria bacterium RIFCSPHIGHO2_12_FULL_44_25]OGY12365.1 MAG: 30S ribosomal protein S11 [Candidatus Blackburnbacteria bacterium RIFCSPHIGHO2_02_FULL_44_20]OGY15070.1 MAG: 30S ribosomal protein S11 [Candidatus Blackburnbacteria bacterium RIFCSPLOWO2_01_FULL_44_43]OGY16009.1 MAG: 30S ribosomal protein S11 [Candidatus Blackburnbacteria 
MAKQIKAKAKTKEPVPYGKVFVTATFNNTLITVTDDQGNALSWGSSGRAGFKGTRKATPYAATTAVESAIRKARDEFSMKSVDVFIKGPGPGRDAALRAIKGIGLRMNMIADVTPMPYNGPRAKKKRRA